MNRKTFLSTLFSLLSLTFTHQALANPVNYTQAVALYQGEDYYTSFEAFSLLLQEDYASVNVNFYLAQSATHLNKFNEAIAAYERILMINPEHTQSKLELAKLYFQRHEYPLATVYFKSALSAQLPPPIEEQVQFYLAKITQATSKSSVTGSIMVGFGQDSNINNAAYADSWFVPTFGVTFNNTTDTIADSYHQEMVTLNHLYDDSSNQGFAINNNLLLYSKNLSQNRDYNILYARYSPALIVPLGDYQLAAALHYDHMNYGGEAYLETYGLTPKLRRKIQSNKYISTQLKLLKKHYLTTANQDRNALFSELSFRYSQSTGANLSWFINLGLQQERKESGVLIDVDYDSVDLLTGLSYQLPQGWRLGGSAAIKTTRYQDDAIFFIGQRQDQNLKLTLTATKSIQKNLSLQAQAEGIKNTSNQAPYEYDKSVISINVISRF